MISFKGAIFDLDGTILDTMPAWENLGRDFLNRYCLSPTENMREDLKPLGFAQTGDYFKEKFSLPQSREEIMEEIMTMIQDQYRLLAPLKPFVREYLHGLKESGVKMCVATATDGELALAALKRLKIAQNFEFIITCDEVGKGKDSPDIYIRAAERLNMPIRDIAVFEDSLHCIITAKQAGFSVVAVYDEASLSEQEKMMELCDSYLFTYEIGGISNAEGIDDSRFGL